MMLGFIVGAPVAIALLIKWADWMDERRERREQSAVPSPTEEP
jgi:hypothetical protein